MKKLFTALIAFSLSIGTIDAAVMSETQGVSTQDQLFDAARTGQQERVRELLREDPLLIDAVDAKGNTVLWALIVDRQIL